MDIKLIVCDLDKTLLRTDGTLSEYTLRVLEKCRRNGVLLAYATARPKLVAAPYQDEAKPDIVISDNGALARMGKNVIYRAVLPKDIVAGILRLLQNDDPSGFITASTDEGMLVNHPVDPADEGWADYKPIYKDFAAGINDDIYKLSPEVRNKQVRDEIAAMPGITYIPFHGEDWCSIVPGGVTKWQSVQKVAAHLGIDTKHIAAFGDDFGDIEMIKGCGIGVAVGNAIDEVKTAADHICDTNDNDGVAKWLEENLCRQR